MIRSMIKVIVYFAIGYAILAIGANTGGNKGLKNSWDKLKKKDQDTVTLKSVLCDLLLAAYGGFGVSYVYFVKKDRSASFIVLLLLEIMFVALFILSLRKYKSKSGKQ